MPKISDAEWEVMQVLWRHSPATAKQMIDQLSQSHDWSPTTIKTLISRLVKKGAVTYEAEGKVYYYSPAVSEKECYRAERRSFLQRLYNGSLAPMLMHFLEDEPLTKEEIEELKKILDEKGQ